MAVDSGQPAGPTDEVSSSSSTSAVEVGHDKILTIAPVPGTTVDDAGTFFFAEQADDASKPVADPETPVPNPVTPIPTSAAVQAANVTVKLPALDPETPVPDPVTPIPEIAIVEQAGQLQVEQPDLGAGLVPPLREAAEVWGMLDEVVGQHYQAYRDGDKGAGVGAMLDGVARAGGGARDSSSGVVVEGRRQLSSSPPNRTMMA